MEPDHFLTIFYILFPKCWMENDLTCSQDYSRGKITFNSQIRWTGGPFFILKEIVKFLRKKCFWDELNGLGCFRSMRWATSTPTWSRTRRCPGLRTIPAPGVATGSRSSSSPTRRKLQQTWDFITCVPTLTAVTGGQSRIKSPSRPAHCYSPLVSRCLC